MGNPGASHGEMKATDPLRADMPTGVMTPVQKMLICRTLNQSDSMSQPKTIWLSGEVCDTSGVYFSDTCGHPIQKEFAAPALFIRCPTCHSTMRWMRISSIVKPEKTLNFHKASYFSHYGNTGNKTP